MWAKRWMDVIGGMRVTLRTFCFQQTSRKCSLVDIKSRSIKEAKMLIVKKKSGSATYDWPIVILVPQPSNHNHLISPSYDQSLELSSLLLHGQIVFARFSFSFFFLCLTNLHIHFNRSKLFDLLTLRCSPWTYSNIERFPKTKT